MPQPKEPASKFKLNTSYIDDYTEWTYYVNYDENKKKVWEKMKPFHVVYYRSPESEKAGHRWYYNSLPRGWDMPYSSMKSGIPNFPTEETFEGNPSYINKAKEYVEKVFDKLVKQKIVTKYLVLTDIQFRNSVKKHRKK